MISPGITLVASGDKVIVVVSSVVATEYRDGSWNVALTYNWIAGTCVDSLILTSNFSGRPS